MDGSASWVSGDIRVDEDAVRLVEECLSRYGRLDVLVNNAGGQYFVPAEAIEPKGWRAVTGLNVGGTERMTSAAFEPGICLSTIEAEGRPSMSEYKS